MHGPRGMRERMLLDSPSSHNPCVRVSSLHDSCPHFCAFLPAASPRTSTSSLHISLCISNPDCSPLHSWSHPLQAGRWSPGGAPAPPPRQVLSQKCLHSCAFALPSPSVVGKSEVQQDQLVGVSPSTGWPGGLLILTPAFPPGVFPPPHSGTLSANHKLK